MTSSPSVSTPICVLGAGPHALSLVLYLIEADPDLKNQIVVLDPSGEWMSTWYEQFARLEIANLRSPGVHHPAPNVDALFSFIADRAFKPSGLPYHLPTTRAFNAFTRHLVEDAALRRPLPLRPQLIESSPNGLMIYADSTTIEASALVIATNPHGRNVPDWVWPLCGKTRTSLNHAADVDLRELDDLSGQQVAVIGGGLTAAHLAVGASRRGAEVHLVSRRPLRIQDFDTEPGWLGPKHLRAFNATPDMVDRLELARKARNGGSIPGWMRDRLDSPGIEVHESVEVVRALPETGFCELHLRGGVKLHPDRIWLATGTTPNIEALRCLKPIAPDIASIDGIPITDDGLRVGLHPVHVMGRLATTTLGPAAGNLWGARNAARRITRAITGVDVDNLTTSMRPT